MSIAAGIVEIQAEALLRRLAREQEIRCRRARDEASEQARAILRRARREARQRVAHAVAEERRNIERALTNRRAALDTTCRQREQSTLRQLLDDAWRLLPAALEARWNDTQARTSWCRSAAAVARDCLVPGSHIVVELAAGTAPAISREVLAAVRSELEAQAELCEVDGLTPGLRLRAGNACMDATTAGLLASSDQVGAELLAEFDRLRPAATTSRTAA